MNGGGVSSPTRGVKGGGYSTPTNGAIDVIEYITIQTLGDSVDFGNLTVARTWAPGISNAHGGLG